MGAIRIHDRRPESHLLEVDEYAYGPLIDARRGRHPLDLGDAVRLPDGSQWPVVSSRIWRTGTGWRQAVAVGVELPVGASASVVDWASLHRVAG